MEDARKLAAVILVAAGVAVGAGGCGSSYTKQDFVRRAEGICLDTTRSVRSVPAPRFTGTAAQQRQALGHYLGRVAPLVQAEARRLTALPKPPGKVGEQRLRERWLAAVHTSAAKLQQLADAAQNGDAGAVASVSTALAAVPVVALAAQYGAHGCAGPGASYAHALTT